MLVPVSERDTVGVGAHAVERRAAQPRLAAVRLVAADLEGAKASRATPLSRRCGGRSVWASCRCRRGGRSTHRSRRQHRCGSRQKVDGVEAVACVRPGVDLLIEFGDEAAGEHLGALPVTRAAIQALRAPSRSWAARLSRNAPGRVAVAAGTA